MLEIGRRNDEISCLSGYLVLVNDRRRGKRAHFVCEEFFLGDILMTAL